MNSLRASSRFEYIFLGASWRDRIGVSKPIISIWILLQRTPTTNIEGLQYPLRTAETLIHLHSGANKQRFPSVLMMLQFVTNEAAYSGTQSQVYLALIAAANTPTTSLKLLIFT